jgi:hypothetical protein
MDLIKVKTKNQKVAMKCKKCTKCNPEVKSDKPGKCSKYMTWLKEKIINN